MLTCSRASRRRAARSRLGRFAFRQSLGLRRITLVETPPVSRASFSAAARIGCRRRFVLPQSTSDSGSRVGSGPAGGQAREEVLTVVTCTASEPQVQEYFLHVCETVVRIVGPIPTQSRIVEVVQRLIDLFQRITRPSSRSVVGLIGELYVIARSRDPAQAVRAWRSADNDHFDFALEDLRLEVKASSERVRAHYLSAEQCQPPPGTVGVLASLFIEITGGGMSVQELLRAIEARLAANSDLVLKLQEIVAETLGQALPVALHIRFDERLAQASLQLYDLATVPGIRENIPVEVTQVRFRADLSRTPTITPSVLADRDQRTVGVLPQT